MKKYALKFTKDDIRRLKRLALEKKLKGSEILNEYTEDEMAESFNGAGSSADSELNRWFLTKLLAKKLPAVLIHDMKYRKGGSEEDFKRVNEELEYNIANSDGDEKSKWWSFVGRKAKEYSNERGRPGWGMV